MTAVSRENASPPLAIFGGTFDPLHRGHLETIQALRGQLPLPEVRLMVSARPPHRPPPGADGAHRLAMVECGVIDHPGLVADGSELGRPGPSYTVWTLRRLQGESSNQCLALIIGGDATTELPTWYHWEELLSLTHLIVLPRPGWDGSVPAPLAATVTRDFDSLCYGVGRIFIASTPELAISASDIRAHISRGESVADQLPSAVWEYIQEHQLYGFKTLSRGRYAV